MSGPITNLPTYQDEDGQYEITPEVMEIYAKLMAMPPKEYLRARIYLAPFAMYFEACRRNDLFSSYFAQLCFKDYWFYQTQFGGTAVSDSFRNAPKPPKDKAH